MFRAYLARVEEESKSQACKAGIPANRRYFGGMSTEIRLMDQNERATVALLFHDVWHETQGPLQDPRMSKYRSLAFFEDRMEQRAGRTIVGLIDGRIGGFAVWTGGRLNSLFCERRCRGQGLGEALCLRAEAEMTATGAQEFELDCVYGNNAGRRFYERLGWRVGSLELLESETPEGVCHVQSWRMVKTKGPV